MATAERRPLHRTKKSDGFQVVPCPECGNNFKVLRGTITNLPEECPICNGSEEPAETAADNTIVMNQKTIGKLSQEVSLMAGKVRRLESDVKSILGVLGRTDTALNGDVPESTKTVAEPPATDATPGN